MAQAKSIQHVVNVGNDNNDQVQQLQSNSGHTPRRTSENHSATMSIGELLNPSGYMIVSSDEDKPITRPANPDENTFKQEDLHMNTVAQSSIARDKAVQRRGHSCTIKTCPNKAVSKGRCISHGGGCRCKIVGCKNGAKMYGLCHLHGGRKKCKFTGCGKFAKSLGLCWAHGRLRVYQTQSGHARMQAEARYAAKTGVRKELSKAASVGPTVVESAVVLRIVRSPSRLATLARCIAMLPICSSY
ncbi:hypothetical protein AC1031_021153 [Aphanomyces cochlioides]|nr:hypothetical protein AC1031_021153 [Aphanomyces cochlioides]